MHKARAVSPDFPGIGVAEGVFLEQLGRIDEAEAHYKRMIRDYPGDWQIYQRLAQLLLDHDKVEQSIQYFESASRAAPDEYYPYQGLVSAYYKLGRYQDALTALQRLADQHPEDKSIIQYIGELRESIRSGKLLPGMAADSSAAEDTTGGGAAPSAGSDGN
jgi:tetratricopeptide (TPR) repeat protein